MRLGQSGSKRLVVIVVSHALLARCASRRKRGGIYGRAVAIISAGTASGRARAGLRCSQTPVRVGPPESPMASFLCWLSAGAASASGLPGAQEVSNVLSCDGS